MRFPLPRVDRYMQYLSAFGASLIIASLGASLSWPSPTLPILSGEDSPLGRPITKNEGSWLVSSFLLATVVGCLFSRLMLEKCGRKTSILLAGIPCTISWLTTAFAKSITVLYVCRVLGGIGGAISVTGVPMYNSEIADKDIRGRLGSLIILQLMGGNLYILAVGPFLSYEALALSCGALPIIFMIFFFFMPESPYYLIKADDREGARKNVQKFLGTDDKILVESKLNEIEYTVKYDIQNRGTLWELLSKKDYRKSLIIMVGIKTLHSLSGVHVIQGYLQTIVESSGSNVSPEISSVLSGVASFMSAVLGAVIIDMVGRKTLLITSATGCTIALFGEGLYFFLRDSHIDVDALAWLPTTCLAVYLLMHSMGVGGLPHVLLGEVFATNIKEVACSLFIAYATFLSFLITKFFEPISSKWGSHVSFWIFSAVCGLGVVFVIFVVPETKGKTFEEIQAMLNSNRRKSVGDKQVIVASSV